MEGKAQVIVLEANDFLKDIVSVAINELPFATVVFKTSSAQAVQEYPHLQSVDILLSDFQSKDGNLVDLLESLKQQEIHLKTLLFAAQFEQYFLKPLMDLGVLGCLDRENLQLDEIGKAIRSLFDGKIHFNSIITPSFVQEKWIQPMQNRLPNFTEREYEVLELLCLGHSREQISNDLFITNATIKYHLHKILEKTQFGSSFELVTNLYKSRCVPSIRLFRSMRRSLEGS
ncbi:MAG: response regulator transcription factor [Cyclobacteriaceae bacterium]